MKIIFEHQTPLSGIGFLVKEYVQTHFTSPFHFHDLYELIIIKKSYGKLYAGNKVMNFNEDEVYLFGPGFSHCFYNEKSFILSGKTAHAIVIFFKEDFLGKDFFNNTEFAKIKVLLTKSKFGVKIALANTHMQSLFDEITKEKGMNALIIFLQLLSQLSNSKFLLINETHSKIKLTNRDSTRLAPVFKYVIENYKEELESKRAAELVYLNEAAFCRYFKSRTEQTFSQFVNDVRITQAMSLLLTEEWDIIRICYASGFKNLSYFNRQFKEIIGQSPKEYRKAFEQSDNNLIMDTAGD